MAEIRNMILTVGRVAPGRGYAKVTFTARFTNNQVAANQRHRVRIHLYEEDDAADFFVMSPDGRPRRLNQGDSDDWVGTIDEIWIQPNGNNDIPVERDREWTFPDLNEPFAPVERFRAFASIVPELAMGDWELSQIVNLDIN